MNLESLIKIGNVVNTFGRKGSIKVLLAKNLILVDEQLATHFFFYEDEYRIMQPLRIESYSQSQVNLLVIKFRDIDSLSSAERLKNADIYSLKTDNLFTSTPDYLSYEIVFKLDNHQVNVKVSAVMNNGLYDLFQFFWNNQEVWIPNVAEYVVNIDDNEQKIYVQHLERLI
ncbi:ribosome maturation factor RimM [Mesoplasma whartonense]|uniref:ribosome maturation factor RimM n=1 Tax=Mesoplasma whartonense TaxID=2878854 RepID=UPI0020229F22|nr:MULTISPECIES: hypothetical protein [unclassified Mesoplasma]MCL8212621.1 Ribosome maturation factor RimM [Mesoplasma sp. JKS002661]MCL8216221.1 Ribosome maturation factor RimM [Mesoplasma sp. JKS002657]